MSCEWRIIRADEFCCSVADGTHDSPKSCETGHFLITSKHLNDYSLDFDSAYRISEDDYAKVISRSKVEQGDILYSMIGTIGKIYREKDAAPDYAIKNVGLFRFGGNESKSLWMYYYLKSPQAQQYFESRRRGSTQGYVPLGALRELPVPVASLPEQKAIAAVLSALDDKIELNNKINKTLEEIAQAIFKSWFVDFEPFQDGEFVDSELGMIPACIKTCFISDIPHCLETGKRPKGGVHKDTIGVPSVGADNIKSLASFDYSKVMHVPAEYANKMQRGHINGYEVLIYKDGGKPGEFHPHFTVFGEGFPFNKFVINEHVFKLDFGSPEYNVFMYFYFQTDYVIHLLESNGGKAAIPGINQNDITSVFTFSPENEYVREFGKYVLPTFTTILYNCKENRQLSILRDTLLPKLMSGEIRVPVEV